MSKILGIDWGEKRSGVAISDELQILAKPFKTIETKNLKDFLKIIDEEKIKKIVIGRPRNIDGSLGQQAEKVSLFVVKLKNLTKTPIVFEDETNTTRIVKSILIKEGVNPQKHKDLVNKKAAQLILQGYLDEVKK